jgi:hypothetical protein
MNPLKPEQFIEYINKNQWACTECGTISAPIKNLMLSVDDELQLSMQLTSDKSSISKHVEHPAGTVRRLDNYLQFNCSPNVRMSVYDYQRKNKKVSLECVERYSIGWVEISLADESIAEYTIEWLDNVHDFAHSWPDAVEFDEETITIGKNDDKLKITIPSEDFGFGFSSACMQLNIGNVLCYFFHLNNMEQGDKKSPGFLLFKGKTDKALREKILISLSFIIGRQLISIGHCDLDKNWNPLVFSCQSSRTATGQALYHVSQPPLNIYSFHTFMDGDLISRLISKILDKYDILKFDRIMWRYWFARYATMHAEAVQVGAIIESLQSIYLEINSDKISTTLIDKNKFRKKIRPALANTINSLDLNENEKTFFIDKLNELNKLSLKKKSELFFSYIGLRLSSLELQAWQQRNDSAHGNLYESEKTIDVIRESKVLTNILHRQIIKLLDLGNNYIDYYSIHIPVRSINQGCELET